MATAAIFNKSQNRLGGSEGNTYGGNVGGRNGGFGNQMAAVETVGLSGVDRSGRGVIGGERGSRTNFETPRRGRDLSGAEEEEDAGEEPTTKRVKITNSDETWEVPAYFFKEIVETLDAFQTKNTVWYGNPEAEKKRDKTAFVLWKGRTRPDGTMNLTVMDSTRTVREVIATEVSVAQQFKNIFDPNSASRIFELVSGGANIQKAVFQTLNEQNECGSGSD